MATQFLRETNNFKTTKTGKMMQDFVVKKDGLTSGLYTHWSFPDDEVFVKGVYEIDTFDLDLRTNNGFTNLVLSNPTFKPIKQ